MQDRHHNCLSCQYSTAEAREKRELFISPFDLMRRCPLDGVKEKQFKLFKICCETVKPVYLPPLQKIPEEMFHQITEKLDIASLVALRRTSQLCRGIVDTSLMWKNIVDHAPSVLRAVLSTEMGRYILLSQLHQALTTQKCAFCDEEYGGYFSLFEAKRVCSFCIRNKDSFRPIELRVLFDARSRRDSALAPVKSLPQLKVVPGKYGPLQIPSYRMAIVQASKVEFNPYKKATSRERDLIRGKPSSHYVPQDPFYDSYDEFHTHLVTWDYLPSEGEKEASLRYMAAVPFPYLDVKIQESDLGTRCKECFMGSKFDQHIWWDTLAGRGLASDEQREKLAEMFKLGARIYVTNPKISAPHHGTDHEDLKKGEAEYRSHFMTQVDLAAIGWL